jgi:hypothetical protein
MKITGQSLPLSYLSFSLKDLKPFSYMSEPRMVRDYRAEVERAFTYHAPKGDQPERYVKLREKAKELALLMLEVCPEAPDRTRAINMLSDSIMVANASIARNE